MGMQFVLVSLEFRYDDILLIRLWIEETRGGMTRLLWYTWGEIAKHMEKKVV